MNETAIAAGLEVARAKGLRCEDPVVLRDAWHVLIHLRPLPIVVRVSSSLPFPEGPHPSDIVRELEVASQAARAGAPVIPPASEVEAAPYRHDGHVVTFWRYIEPFGEVDARAAGHALRVVHEALADYHGRLPGIGHPEDTAAMLAVLPATTDIELLQDVMSRRPEVDGQGLNGDAHLLRMTQSCWRQCSRSTPPGWPPRCSPRCRGGRA